MKNKEQRPTKKKILMYYLILAACLLVIAAVTVGVVFGFRAQDITDKVIDGGDTNKPDEPDEPDDPVDTSTQYEFISPVKDIELKQAHVFAYDQTLDRYCFHVGMDFVGTAGTSVLAAVDGTVKSVVKSDKLYGAVITLEHANGVTTVYKFVEPDENLKEGDKVNRGDAIGTIAAANGAENADGDHLHFEVFKNGKVQDPDDYLNINSK